MTDDTRPNADTDPDGRTQEPGPSNRVSRRNVLKGAALSGAALATTAAAPAMRGAGAAGAATATAGAVRSGPLQLARVWARSKADRALLGGFDDTHNVFDDGSIEVLLWPGDVERLRETGLRFRITETDLEARDAALREAASRVRLVAKQPGETEDGEYRRLPDFEAEMRQLVADHPDKARLVELPYRTLEERVVYGIEIATDVDRQDGRPVFYNDGIHHAREWPAAEVPIMWAYDLLENYGEDPRITNIVDRTRNICVPVVNPDGYNHSREAMIDQSLVGGPVIGEAYWRKNRRSETTSEDAYGIDNNRNYAFAWGDDIGGSSSSKSSQTYRGDYPLSEIESRNVAWLLGHRNVTLLITHHTSGDLVLWPWGDADRETFDDPIHEGLGRAAAHYNGYRPMRSIFLYATTGTTMDYGYGSYGAISYTFEHAGSSFHPDYLSTVPAMYARNREAFILMCEQVCMRPEHRLTPTSDIPPVTFEHGLPDDKQLNHSIVTGRLVGKGGGPTAGTLRIYKRFDTPLWENGDGSNPIGKASVPEELLVEMEVGDDGVFEWHINPSTRPSLAIEGRSETYELTAVAGDTGAFKRISIARGEELDLGNIPLL